jgi:hypothetical protein
MTMKKTGIYRLTPKEDAALKEYIMEHLQKWYIRPLKSSMASPFFFVDKKDGKLRPVQDYQKLNEITVKNAAPLPLIPNLIDKLRGAWYFTKLDVRWGYNNIHIKDDGEYKAAFKTSLGLYEPLVMTFGLCNAPATFQTFMSNIFKDLINTGQVVIYLDDILVFTHTTTQLDKLTRQVLQHLERYDLFLKPEKCFFDHTSIEYLGVIITEGQVKMDPAKIDGITNWPTPKTLKNVQAFLGFCNFYRHFIKDFSAVTHPLSDLTHKDTPFFGGTLKNELFEPSSRLSRPRLYWRSLTMTSHSGLLLMLARLQLALSLNNPMLWIGGTRLHTIPSHSSQLSEITKFTIWSSSRLYKL